MTPGAMSLSLASKAIAKPSCGRFIHANVLGCVFMAVLAVCSGVLLSSCSTTSIAGSMASFDVNAVRDCLQMIWIDASSVKASLSTRTRGRIVTNVVDIPAALDLANEQPIRNAMGGSHSTKHFYAAVTTCVYAADPEPAASLKGQPVFLFETPLEFLAVGALHGNKYSAFWKQVQRQSGGGGAI